MIDDIFLPLAVKNTGISLQAGLSALPLKDANWRDVRDVCTCYRVLALGHLLLTSDPADFYVEYLCKSGLCWLHYLQNNPPDRTVTSWGTSFFDSVSCMDSKTALNIATNSPANHNPAYEYEEDFLYLRILMSYYSGIDSKSLSALQDKWRLLLNGKIDARLNFCEALISDDLDQLESTLLTAIQTVSEELEKASELEIIPANHYAALAHISTEVITWLHLCKAKGLELEADYALAPSPAILSMPRTLPADDSWRYLTKTYNSLK